ncbi:MAG: 4-alpha-glucanotransferase [Planctomycetota bacterium]
MSSSPQLDQRAAGVLLHPTSLPGGHGSGDLGPAADKFVDWLSAAEQRWWQMLPVGPADTSGSPYNGDSAFAGNALLISPEGLAEMGLLTRREAKPPFASTAKVNYPRASHHRRKLLRLAFTRCTTAYKRQIEKFRAQHAAWLDDYALFAALRWAHDLRPWWEWDLPIRKRQKRALAAARKELAEDTAFHVFEQWLFDRQWNALRKRCAAADVGLIGDLPIFVAHDSADVWANRKLFDLNTDGTAKTISGVPPDLFSKTGQLWGHPLYRWNTHAADGYAWWTARLARTFAQFDAVRIDHFLGFNRFWATPGKHKTAMKGRWKPGPGGAFFTAVEKKLGKLPIIAEDLGILTPEAEALRDKFAFPGMRVLQFAFGDDDSYHAPHRHVPCGVSYTGTHDNHTARGWYAAASAGEKKRLRDYAGATRATVAWDLVRASAGSPARLAVAPAQDILELPGSARMNVPGTTEGNWRWRLTPDQLNGRIAAKLRRLTRLTGRALGS